MIYILYDKPKSMEDMSFTVSEIEEEFIEVYPECRCDSIKKVLHFCNSVYAKLNNSDVVICWYDFMGVIIWWLSKIRSKEISIIALNILLKDKKTIKNAIAKSLYKPALKADNFTATVTTKAYGVELNRILDLNKDYYILHDPYHDTFQISSICTEKNNTVFCGGRNGRDWTLMIEVAQNLKNVNFLFVMSSADFDIFKSSMSSNVTVITDVPYDEFLKNMCESEIVALPLNTWAPAGLTVLFQAIANNKLVLTTGTVSTEEYLSVTPELLCYTIEDWLQKIEYYLIRTGERQSICNKLKQSIEQMCSEKNYSQTINRILLETKRGE